MTRKARPPADRTAGDPRGVFFDLFDADDAIELKLRAEALSALSAWLDRSGLTQARAAKQLGTTQARVSDIKRGKIGQFSLDMLVRLAGRAGLNPELRLVA